MIPFLGREMMKNCKLTPKQYRALLLRCEGLRYREIGEEMGITPQDAWDLVRRGVERIRKCEDR